jgi:hypothetical protein
VSDSTDKRSELRVSEETTFFVEIYSQNDEESNDATRVIICNSLDISANGIQLQMDTEVPTGSILRVCADLKPGQKALYLVGEVRWIKKEGDHYNIGFELYDAENTDISGWKNQIAGIL